jgi:diazepam-binding inhibitor (GABA receptor modulating acyl-CoA-binding protein)
MIINVVRVIKFRKMKFNLFDLINTTKTQMFKTNTQMNFEEAAEAVKLLRNTPNDNVLLELYGLYKQSTVGDINIPRPGFWDLTGKAKWDSWKSYEKLPSAIARDNYITLVTILCVSESEEKDLRK